MSTVAAHFLLFQYSMLSGGNFIYKFADISILFEIVIRYVKIDAKLIEIDHLRGIRVRQNLI